MSVDAHTCEKSGSKHVFSSCIALQLQLTSHLNKLNAACGGHPRKCQCISVQECKVCWIAKMSVFLKPNGLSELLLPEQLRQEKDIKERYKKFPKLWCVLVTQICEA